MSLLRAPRCRCGRILPPQAGAHPSRTAGSGSSAQRRVPPLGRAGPPRGRAGVAQGSVWTTTSAMPSIRWRSSSSSSPASVWASVSEASRADGERQEQHAPGLGGEQPQALRVRAGDRAHHAAASRATSSSLGRAHRARRESALERLEVGLHVGHPRAGEDRLLDALCDLVGAEDVEVGRELEVQRDARGAVLLEDRDVVRLAHQRLGERDREHPVAEVQAPRPGLDVDDDVGAREGLLRRPARRGRRSGGSRRARRPPGR